MSWKDLFIENTDPKTETPKGSITEIPKVNTFPTTTFPKTSETTFPKTSEASFPSFPNTTAVRADAPNPYLEKIFAVYDNGFTKLNQPGYDFFEFFKAVSKSGIDNPQVYEMALEMGQAMDSNVSKQSLLSQADYYITELTKVYNGFNSEGQSKKSELVTRKSSESQSLTAEISSLKQQLESIQTQIQTKQFTLNEIDTKYQPDIDQVEQKLSANDVVKDNLISTINKVKTNISNNLK
jgi:hypothetical protein